MDARRRLLRTPDLFLGTAEADTLAHATRYHTHTSQSGKHPCRSSAARTCPPHTRPHASPLRTHICRAEASHARSSVRAPALIEAGLRHPRTPRLPRRGAHHSTPYEVVHSRTRVGEGADQHLQTHQSMRTAQEGRLRVSCSDAGMCLSNRQCPTSQAAQVRARIG